MTPYFVGLDPPAVELVEALQVNDQHRRQPPDLQLLERQLVLLAERAVVLLVLAELLLPRESLQALDQRDGLRRGFDRRFNGRVFDESLESKDDHFETFSKLLQAAQIGINFRAYTPSLIEMNLLVGPE